MKSFFGTKQSLNNLPEEEAEGSCSEEVVSSKLPFLEIEARISENNNILIGVLSEKKKGVLVRLFSKMEDLNLSIVNANTVSFGDAAVDITVVAEVENGFTVTADEVMESLRATLQANA